MGAGADHIKSITDNHAFRAGTATAVGGITSGSAGGGWGVLAGTGGCVAGTLYYYWHRHDHHQ